MFLTRLISGIVLVLGAFAVLLSGRVPLYVAFLLLGIIGMHEFYRAVRVEEKGISLLSIPGYLGFVLCHTLLFAPEKLFRFYPAALLLTLVVIMTVYVLTFPRYQYDAVFASFFGMVYAGCLLDGVVGTRLLEDGIFTVWLIFISAWGCDTCAYCAGRLLGKHKMAPVLSPKKTIEGAVGGVLGAALLGAIYALAIGKALGHTPVLAYTLISFFGALISMVGDLAASAIKRNAGIKDYGHLIPGHGGVLDRFDSILFTAPVIWLLAQLLL